MVFNSNVVQIFMIEWPIFGNSTIVAKYEALSLDNNNYQLKMWPQKELPENIARALYS